MNHKYIVASSEEERKMLRALAEKRQAQGYRIKHAQILLKLDEISENQGQDVQRGWRMFWMYTDSFMTLCAQ